MTADLLPTKPPAVLRAECNATIIGEFAKILKASGRCGVDGSGDKHFSSNPRLRTVGAGAGTQLLGDAEVTPWVKEESYLFSRVPGKNTVPRTEAWAMYLVLQVWDGTYDLEIITDASYTYSGMDLVNRQKHLRGVNKDIWQLIYKELDWTMKAAIGQLDITKLKSHSDAEHLLCRETPLWQMGVNNLADMAAELFSDHVGDKYQMANFRATEAKHKKVCLRLAALEAAIRRGTEEKTRVAADIITTERERGERQRMQASAKADSRIKRALNPHGHNLVFQPTDDNKPLCNTCKTAVHLGQVVPDNCKNCGKQRGTWRCHKCTRWSKSRLDRFWTDPCSGRAHSADCPP